MLTILCSVRRIKCDEGKPECNNCIRAAKSCHGNGYSDMRAAAASSTPLGNTQPSMALAPSRVKLNRQDLHAFNILRQKTMGQITGMFDRAFWTVDVLRASHVYPAIWHACLAISAMHERLALPATTSKDRETRRSRHAFALGQYNTAIRHLVEIAAKPRLSDSDQETIVLASTLFTGICCMDGDVTQAIIHARNGLGVFYQWQKTRPSGVRGDYRTGRVLSSDTLTTLTAHVSLQVFDRTCIVDNPPPHIPPELFQCAETPFMSANAAYQELVPIASTLLELSQDRILRRISTIHVEEDTTAAAALRDSYLAALRAWEGKFEEYLATRDPSSDDQHCILMLRLLWMCVTIYTQDRSSVEPGLTRREFEHYVPSFERFVELAEQLYEEQDAAETEGPPVFSFSLALCKFIFYVGLVCRSTRLRERLTSVLRRNPRRDGVWDSEMVALVLEAVVAFEERTQREALMGTDCHCECEVGVFACDEHRVAAVKAEYMTDGLMDLEILRQRDVDCRGKGEVVRVRWSWWERLGDTERWMGEGGVVG
ncbi:hypothetical protein K4F52_002100 [Lecanicillium sp. MT-2017a]|nr:hypothetical protein K4F52_002100 [Lecanicillium sp. MT-2017a]